MPGPAKKSYPLRVNAELMDAMQRWADDELRSLNGQIEYVLREALKKQGRLKRTAPAEVLRDDEGKDGGPEDDGHRG